MNTEQASENIFTYTEINLQKKLLSDTASIGNAYPDK